MSTTNGQQEGAGLQVTGGAAILAPPSAFQNGVPENALILVPLKTTDELGALMDKGPAALTLDQMWKLLGFNGPAVQVQGQDDQGRPVPMMIGLEDLLAGLDKHWSEQPDDLNRARIYAQELLKHERLQKAEQVLSKIVAKGGVGNDWLALGVAQLQQEKYDKAEGTLKGAQNLLKESPYPSLHLAKLYEAKKTPDKEKESVEKALAIDAGNVDGWAYLYQFTRRTEDADKAATLLEARATELKNAAPLIALQGFFAGNEETIDKAVDIAKKAVALAPEEPIALLCLSALYGQKGDLEAVIRLLQPHESKMSRDVRLANNYFQALFQARQIEKVTKLLNALIKSPTKEVAQYAQERTKLVAQYLQQQQAQLAGAQRKA